MNINEQHLLQVERAMKDNLIHSSEGRTFPNNKLIKCSIDKQILGANNIYEKFIL